MAISFTHRIENDTLIVTAQGVDDSLEEVPTTEEVFWPWPKKLTAQPCSAMNASWFIPFLM